MCSSNSTRHPERRLNTPAIGKKKKLCSKKSAAASGALTLALLAALLLPAVPAAQAQTETVLYSFDGTDGFYPKAPLVRDTKGNLYGTTVYGGTYAGGLEGCGTAFELTPAGIETILHNFGETATDGCNPQAGLVRDTEGNLYGTTSFGGTYDYGTVFELAPSGTETILHSFDKNGTDGVDPTAGLVLDTKGNLYGTTQRGGTGTTCSPLGGCGTVFELTPSGTETILHSFDKNGTDGIDPTAGLVLDTKGNLYGTTEYGGTGECSRGCGTVFELTPSGTETILHSFNSVNDGTDGISPLAPLVRDTEGNLYGTTVSGGIYGVGTVFEVTSSGTETILHSFAETATDGGRPYGGLVMDTQGNLYGTTYNGAKTGSCLPSGCGSVFKLTLSGTETTLHRFVDNGTDGTRPNAGLVRDTEGNLYGTTLYGGTYGYGGTGQCRPDGCGTVFEVTPK